MNLWKIDGTDYKTMKHLETLYIEAKNFDEALREARKTHSGYCCGQIAKLKGG